LTESVDDATLSLTDSVNGEAVDMVDLGSLPEERQEAVIGAGLAAFGRNGYKKASTADVAAAAGISKGMVFHYFGTKKGLYLFLCGYCKKAMGEALAADEGGDFFDRVRRMAVMKVEFLKRKPHMLEFLESMYQETDPEVALEVEEYRNLIAPSQQALAIKAGDREKFKEGASPEQALKMLTWMGAGAAAEISGATGEEKMNELLGSFDDCISVMKKCFYKEEFL
jgi:AcrR family transcriptional regulator